MEKTDTIYKAWGIEEGVHEACGLKPMLSAKGLIESLKAKGVTFDRCSEEDAIRSLLERDTYLHLASYRKLFQKHLEGERKGQYVRLDFADLLDLDSLDGLIRRVFLAIANDVERMAKTQLVARIADDRNEDGYGIVADFMTAQSTSFRNTIARNLKARSGSHENADAYSGKLIEHYKTAMPIWVFLEVVPFGTLLAFMLFCATRWNDKDLKATQYRLTYVKAIRNCCSHLSCILNGFDDSYRSPYTAPFTVQEWLSNIGIKKTKTRKSKMQNRRMQQLVTTLCAFSLDITEKPSFNDALLRSLSKALRNTAIHYGEQNAFVSYFSFLAEVIDSSQGF